MTEKYDLVARLEKHATFAGRASDIALSIGLAGTSDWDQVAGGVDIFGVQDDCAQAATRLEAQSRALTASQEAIDTLREENERLRKALAFYANLPKEWTINAGQGLTYGSLELLGEKARAALDSTPPR